MAVINIITTDFDKVVRESKIPVVVDFFADWCGPCKMLSPVLESFSEEYGAKARFVKLNTDEARELSEEFGISGIPCLIIFSAGKEVGRIIGYYPKDNLKVKLEKLLGPVIQADAAPKQEGKSIPDAKPSADDDKKQKLLSLCQKYADVKGLKLNPDKGVLDVVLKGLLANEKKYGFRYCPCRIVVGDKEEDRKIICPCIYHQDEIKKDGYCHCMLYFAKDHKSK